MVNTVKFSQFVDSDLSDADTEIVGISSPSGGVNVKKPATNTWTTGSRPISPYQGLEGYNTTINMPEYWNGTSWVSVNGSGGGTVNAGSINQMAWYATSGTAVSGLATANNAILITSGTGVPSMVNTLGQGLAIASSVLSVGKGNNIPFNTGKGFQDNNANILLLFDVTSSAVNYIRLGNNSTGNAPYFLADGSDTNVPLSFRAKGNAGVKLQGTQDGSNAATGEVGQFVSSIVLGGSAVSLTTVTAANVTSISLGAGDWDVWGNVAIGTTGNSTNVNAWISTSSATLPDPALRWFYRYPTTSALEINNPVPYQRISVATTTTVYLSAQSDFTTGIAVAYGAIYARRVR